MSIETVGQEMRDFVPMIEKDGANVVHFELFRRAWQGLAEKLANGDTSDNAFAFIRDMAVQSRRLHNKALESASYGASEHQRAEANALEVVQVREELESKYRLVADLRQKLATAELERDRLQARNDAQATTIRTYDSSIRELTSNLMSYREQRDAEGARAVKAELEAADCRTERDSLAVRLNRSDARVDEVAATLETARQERDLATERMNLAEGRLAGIVKELGGLTLAQLPNGAYGAVLASLYLEAR